MDSLPLSFFEKLPKTDLHVHLDGSLRLETILDLARHDRVELPASDPVALAQHLRVGMRSDSLVEYLRAFDITLRVMQTEESLYRAAYELAEDAARENVRWMEVRYSPMLHTRRGLRLTTIIEAVLYGLRQGQKDHGIESGVIICGIRNISPASSLEMAELAVAYKNRGVVGFDLAGAEYDYPAKHHLAAFQLILSNNINCTAHAGEAYGPESVAQAIHYCGAHRIGHGVRLREDGGLLNYVLDHRIPLEICPSSNLQTGAVSDLDSHPLRLYQHLGCRVTVNTDNRLITNTTVSKELWLAHRHLGFGFEETKAMLLAGFKSAFLPFHVRQDLVRRIKAELATVRVPEPVAEEAAKTEPEGPPADQDHPSDVN